jgi:hypothetical protein
MLHVLKTDLNPLQDLLLPNPRIITGIDCTNHFPPFNSVLLLAKSPVDGCPEDSFSAASGVTTERVIETGDEMKTGQFRVREVGAK